MRTWVVLQLLMDIVILIEKVRIKWGEKTSFFDLSVTLCCGSLSLESACLDYGLRASIGVSSGVFSQLNCSSDCAVDVCGLEKI